MIKTEMMKALTMIGDLAWGECADDIAVAECAWADGPRVDTECLVDDETNRKVVVVDSHDIWFDCYESNGVKIQRVKSPLNVAVFLRTGHILTERF
jgi:hypothetical protein